MINNNLEKLSLDEINALIKDCIKEIVERFCADAKFESNKHKIQLVFPSFVKIEGVPWPISIHSMIDFLGDNGKKFNNSVQQWVMNYINGQTISYSFYVDSQNQDIMSVNGLVLDNGTRLSRKFQVVLPKGGIYKLTGKHLEFGDDPINIKSFNNIEKKGND